MWQQGRASDAPLPFSAGWWRAGEGNWSDPLHRRHRIADWLVLSHRLVGLHRNDVVALLGEPPPTEYFKEWDMVYLLGAERGFISIDSEWLVLRLDAAGYPAGTDPSVQGTNSTHIGPTGWDSGRPRVHDVRRDNTLEAAARVNSCQRRKWRRADGNSSRAWHAEGCCWESERPSRPDRWRLNQRLQDRARSTGG